jgi:thiamine transport system ATP-binding protein
MLTLKDVSVSYDGTPAVREAGLELPDGQVLAVLGPSGCGKSTLLRAVAGFEPLVTGSVAWDGADLARVPTHRRGFALMFQDGQLFNHLTVARNIGYALRLHRTPGVDARVEELLSLVGLEGYADRLPATLSGGERQRVALARCLAVRPRLLLLDEPLSALDAGLRQRLATDLRAILTQEGITALMVTHDHEEAFVVADRLAVMRAGRIVQQGDIGEVWRAPVDPETALFLGYARVLEGPAVAQIVPDVSDIHYARRRLGTSGTIAPMRLAVRRSAFRVEPQGRLHGTVVEARTTPEQVRLVVDVEGIGELDAVAPLDQHPGAGEPVRLSVDATRTAVVGGENPVSPPAGRSLD